MGEIIQQKDNRRVFIDTLIELAEKDEKIVLIVPDVGFNYIEKFQEKFPDRFFNFGVTESSTIMIAVGMAQMGFKPYVYSMINFVLFRPYEMVRNGIYYHKANVKLVGVQGSSSYKFLGFSHNMTENEDMDLIRSMTKGDASFETAICYEPQGVDFIIKEFYSRSNPAYIRL